MKNLILRTILVLSLGCTMMALLSSCATSPLGRKQLILMPAGQMTTMGISTFDGLKKETPIETNPTTNAYVKCVASAVAAQASQSAGVKEWEIIVFKDQTPNAFALPGGKIGVHTGILPVTKTPAQLAAVLGHEVGHVIAQHGNERVSESLGTQLVMTGLSVVTPQTQTGQLIMAGLGVGAQYGIALPHSRT
jgi:predicted Zn-dependent protease